MIRKFKIPLIISGEPALKEKEFARLKQFLLLHFVIWCLAIILLTIFWSELNNVFNYLVAILLGIFVPDLGVFKLSRMKYEDYISEWESKNHDS